MSDRLQRLELLRSFRRNPRETPEDLLRLRETAARLRTGLTPAQRDLRSNFIPEAQAEVEEERDRVRPLQFIFHVLQTGQFVTANIWKEMKDSANTGEPLSETAAETITRLWDAIKTGVPLGLQAGFSGGKRGRPLSFEDIFYEDVPKEERTFFQKAAGFVADVLLDPTTYLTFGATGVARKAAVEFAWTSTKVFMKESLPDVVRKIGQEALQKGRDPSKILKGLSNTQQRAVRDHYNQAFRQAMQSPGGRGGEAFSRGLEEGLQRRLNRLGAQKLETSGGGVFFTGGDETLQRLGFSVSEGFAGAGVRTGKFIGLPIPGAVGRAIDFPMRAGREVFETAKAAFNATPAGKLFQNAWWSIVNSGTVGALKRAFGFMRTPLEQTQHVKLREHDLGLHKMKRDFDIGIDQVTAGLSPEQIAKISQAARQADLARRQGKEVSAVDILDEFGDDPQARDALSSMVKLMEDAKREADVWAEEGIINPFGDATNYFPIHFTDDLAPRARGGPTGSPSPGFTQQQKVGIAQHREINKRYLKWTFGDALDEYADKVGKTPDEIIEDLIDNKGWADVEMNFFDAVKIRMQAHARAATRVKMIRQFREFGIPVDQIPREALNSLGNIGPQALRQVDDPSLKGYLFDKEVAEIIERVYDVTSTNEGATSIRKFWSWTTRFWKGFATLTPRFHIRNAASNQMTGFLKHGLRWFDVRTHARARVAVTYALHKDRYLDILADELSMSAAQANSMLNKTIGTKTLRQIAEEAESLGAIVPRGTFTKEMAAIEGAQRSRVLENPLFKFSQRVGDRIENQARMTSYLLDYTEGIGMRGNAEHAAREARKWFLDYDDLTPFEQGTMRNIIPFYTWMRKNIANQLSGLILHGNLYSIIPKAQPVFQSAVGGAFEGIGGAFGVNLPGQAGTSTNDEDIDFQLLEDWEQNLSVFPVWKDRETGKALLFDPFFAYQDINRIPLFWEAGRFLPTPDPIESIHEVMAAAHPVLKTIAELAFHRDLFRDRPLRDEKTKETEIVHAPVLMQRVLPLLDGIMNLSGHDEGIKMTLDEDGSVKWDAYVNRVVENNMPFIRTIGSIIETAESFDAAFISGKLSDVIEEVSSEPDYNKAFTKALRSLAFMLGAKLREFDEEEREQERANEIRRRAEDARSRERRQLPGQQQRIEERDRRRLLENQRLGLL